MMPLLNGWANFYVIVGSSAGALIGLQFVVIALISNSPFARSSGQASGAFGTPSVVHFGVVLLLSGILSTPWNGITAAAIFWGVVGFVGVVYMFIIIRRMRLQTIYQPVFEDWLCHAMIPFLAYAMLAVSSFLANSNVHSVLFFVAAAALMLLFTGIHNAWDAVTYHVFHRRQQERETSN
jgi:hypothetical protein